MVVLVLAVSTAMIFVSNGYGAYTDGLVQYWDFSQGDVGKDVTASDIVDVLSVGSEKAVVATRVDGCNPSTNAMAIKVPERISYTNMPVQLPFYGDVTNNRTCLWIPQETVMDGGTKKYFSRQVRLPSPTTLAGFTNRTVFLRFRLGKQSGVRYRGLYKFGAAHGDTGGWGLCLDESGQTGNVGGRLYFTQGNYGVRKDISEVNGKKEPGQGSLFGYLYLDRWYDLVVTVDVGRQTDNVNIYLGEAGKYYRDADSASDSEKQPNLYHYRTSATITPPKNEAANIQILGGDEAINSWTSNEPTGWSEHGDYFGHGVCGSFERMMVWDRVLSKEEAFDAMADTAGRELEIGAANSSAGEFAKESAPGIAEVYDVSTMPWKSMRGELTADKPSLSFRFPLPEREEKLGRVLSVVPLLSGCGDVAALELSVNGREAGTMCWKDGERCDLFVPGALMVRDDDGYVTMTLTRIGEISGVAAVDHVSLGGSWMVGSRDGTAVLRGASYRPTSDKYVESLAVSGKYASQYPDLLYGTNSAGNCYTYRPYSLRFEVPGKIAENHRARFSFSTVAMAERGYAYQRQSISVNINGRFFAVMDKLGEGAALNRLDIPAGTFKDGMNVITLANVTDVSKDSYWGVYSPVVKFASHSLEFRNNAGAVMFVR